MKLKFKHQQFQIDAAKAVTDVFQGQPNQSMLEFTHNMGRSADGIQDMLDVVGYYPIGFYKSIYYKIDT